MRVFELVESLPMALWISILFSILIKWGVSLNSYSGQGVGPMFGDFEAQRHWLEITKHLPLQQWYRYDLKYWGLDYPPLTALHSWVLGNIAHAVEPSWVALNASRGNEDLNLKLFMRFSAIITELITLVPAIIWFAFIKYPSNKNYVQKCSLVLLVLINPTLLIIDHGHFQYNSAMLGFSLLGFNAMMTDRYALGSFFFCLALNFKQMALFYAIPVFSYLLGQCLERSSFDGVKLFVKLGVTVVATFVLCFGSICRSLEDVQQILIRVFPVQRGLYEDKVANVWCMLSVVIKMRELFELDTLIKISIAFTLLCVLPSGWFVLQRPTQKQFIFSLIIGSLGFFLFSFQVHEKSILLPALPVSLLLLDYPLVSTWFLQVAMFSMFPLLKRDGLVLAYLLLLGIWNLIYPPDWKKCSITVKLALLTSITVMLLWHCLEWKLDAPKRYPDLYVVLNVLVSTSHFVLFLVYFYWLQWNDGVSDSSKKKRPSRVRKNKRKQE